MVKRLPRKTSPKRKVDSSTFAAVSFRFQQRVQASLLVVLRTSRGLRSGIEAHRLTWKTTGVAVEAGVAPAEVIPLAAARLSLELGTDRAAVTDSADDAAATAQAGRPPWRAVDPLTRRTLQPKRVRPDHQTRPVFRPGRSRSDGRRRHAEQKYQQRRREMIPRRCC